MVKPIHTTVQGRGRFKIEGLYRSDPMKRFLELRLGRERDIISVSASTVTGNILVSFNSDNTHRTISRLINRVLTETDAAQKRVDNTATDSDRGSYPSDSRGKNSDGEAAATSWLHNAIDRLLFPHESIMNRPWHTFTAEDVLSAIECTKDRGLTREIVAKRRETYGSNSLPAAKSRSGWEVLWGQLNTLPTYLLAAAAGVSLLTGGIVDAVVVLGVVAANAVIGYYTETEAEKTISALKHLASPQAEVLRNGKVEEISPKDVVPGDLLVLKQGSYVAADARVIASSRLNVDESMLTGESLPVYKNSRALDRPKTALADRVNMVYMGTQVTGGNGLAVCVAVGRYTEIGRLQMLMAETTSPKTPIERQLETIGNHLVLLFLAICGVVLMLGILRGIRFLPMLRMAISLAASAVPEGLPAAATINMALGITRMRDHRALIRNLQAIETLGAVQTICLDKTGTITRNRMAVCQIHADNRRLSVDRGRIFETDRDADPPASDTLQHLMRVCVLCSDTKINGRDSGGNPDITGSSTERALIRLAQDAGVDIDKLRREYRFININHRSENRLFMSTTHRTPDGHHYYAVKGSPPEVLALCDRQFRDGRIIPVTEADRLAIHIQNEGMADAALRVLGFACASQLPENMQMTESRLVWIGLVGMSDPIRDGVKSLIVSFHQAGIETVMITGDQSTTAFAIARELDLAGGQTLDILDSTELQALDDETMEALAKRVKVYSRVSPVDKLKIVQSLQAAGRTVAMTGDGINDGPALKAADIGIAMGRSGNDVARETADIVLEDDNLMTLMTAVKDGRTTYRNIRKSVRFFLSTNLSEIMVMFFSMAAGIGLPLTVMQLLWINIISDIFPGIALSKEAPEPDVMAHPPRRPDAPLLSNADYRQMAMQSAVISSASLTAYLYGIARYGLGPRAASLAFQSLTVSQLLHAYSCRSENRRLFQGVLTPRNVYLDLAVGGSLALQVLTLVFPPLRRFLGLTPLSLIDAIVAGGSSLLSLTAVEMTTKPHAQG